MDQSAYKLENRKPETKLLSEIAHLTNLLHGSKLKPPLRSRHHHHYPHHHQHQHPHRKTNPAIYSGKRINYRAQQPYCLNGGGGSNRKSNLALSKRFRSLRSSSSTTTAFSSTFKRAKPLSASSALGSRIRINANIPIHKNSGDDNSITSTRSKASSTKIRESLLTKIALTKLKFQNSTGSRFPPYFPSSIRAPPPQLSSSEAASIRSSSSINRPITSSQIALAYQKLKSNDSEPKNNNNSSTSSSTTSTATTHSNTKVISSTSNNPSANNNNLNKGSTTKTKEPEKSSRYYEMEPKSSPIQAIVQRRYHPDSISICLSNTTATTTATTTIVGKGSSSNSITSASMTSSDKFNAVQIQSKKPKSSIIGSLSSSSSSSSSSSDDEREREESDDDYDTQMTSSSQKEKPLSMCIDNERNAKDSSSSHGDAMPSNIAYVNSKADNTSTCKDDSCICDRCNHSNPTECDDDDIQIVQVDKGESKRNVNTNNDSGIRSKGNLQNQNRPEVNAVGGKVTGEKLGQSGLTSTTATTTAVEDPRRSRLLSKLSKLSSYKERRLNEGKSLMPSYLPC